jgi:hypothetical protein
MRIWIISLLLGAEYQPLDGHHCPISLLPDFENSPTGTRMILVILLGIRQTQQQTTNDNGLQTR